MSISRNRVRWKLRPVIAAVLALTAAQQGAGIEFYSDGVVREISDTTAIVELPKWPLTVEKGMKVGFFEITDYFKKEGSEKVIIAKINVMGIGKITAIDGDTIKVSLADASGKGTIRPALGASVLINNTLKHGMQYVLRDDSLTAKLVFQETFDAGSQLGIYWESLPGAIELEKGKLVVDRYKKKFQDVQSPHDATAMIKLNVMGYAAPTPFNQVELTSGSVCFEFDLETQSGIKFSLDTVGYGRTLIGIDYVIGHYQDMQGGIYLDEARFGKLAGSVAGTKHVLITTTPSVAELRVDNNVCKVDLPESFVRNPFKNIVIFTKGKFSIDNFKIWKLPDDSTPREAKVVAFNKTRRKVAILKGIGKEWQRILPGREISFDNNAAKGVILADLKEYAVCAIDAKAAGSVSPDSLITLGQTVIFSGMPPDDEESAPLPKQPAEGELLSEKPPLPAATASIQTVYDEMQAIENITWELNPMEGSVFRRGSYVIASVDWTPEGNMELSPASDLKLESSQGPGYIYPVIGAIAQPVNGQVLGVQAGKAVSCRISREGATLNIGLSDPADASAARSAKYVIVSAQRTRSTATNQVFEITGNTVACDFSDSRQTFWNAVSGKWIVKNGRLTSSSPLEKEGIPAIVSAYEMEGNFRFDFNVVVEKPVRQIFCTYTKDISCMFYSTEVKRGLTFGFGAEGYGGISTDGGVPGAVRIDTEDPKKRDRRRARDEEENVPRWEGHKQYLGKNLEAKLGQPYRIRVEKIGGEMIMYINGRKIHTEHAGYLSGKLQTWIISPESIISIDDVSLTKLPESARIPSAIPPAGCFGYIVAVAGQDVYIDAGIPGLRKSQRIAIVNVEKQMRSKMDPKRILLQSFKTIAAGNVVELGGSLARVTIAGETEPVRPGMKVMTRKCAGTFSLNEQELGGIDEEL